MRVDRISLAGFMCHDQAVVELPPRGVVLVTGPNGAGKSALIEAVAAACWGKTIRGSPFWRAGEECRVEVATDRLVVERRVGPSGKKALEWRPAEGGGREFATASAAQVELDSRIPTFDQWRKCSVFSSADAALFTRATDAERKRLLEQLLGLGRFDRALEAVRADLKVGEQAAAKATSAVERLEAVLDERRGRAADLELTVEEELDAAEPFFRARRAAHDLVLVRGRLAELRAELTASQRAASEAAGLARAEQGRRRLLERSSCPECGQGIGEELKRAARAKLDAAEAAQRTTALAASRTAGRLEGGLRGLEERDAALAASSRAWAAHRAEAEASERRRAEQEARRAKLAADLAAGERELEALKRTAADAGLALAHLRAVERVLGLRGVRAHVLASALAGIESLANLRLDRLFPGARLSLRPFSELKGRDGVVDAISIEVAGPAGGLGYAANSGGQRRRIDLALLLALADVGSVSSARGTVFFDEAFDALDADGVAAASDLIAELAADRAVVVVSHSAALVEQLRPRAALKLAVDGGKISPR